MRIIRKHQVTGLVYDRVLTLTYFMTISNYVTGFSMRKLKQWIFCKLLHPMIGSWGQVNELMEIGGPLYVIGNPWFFSPL